MSWSGWDGPAVAQSGRPAELRLGAHRWGDALLFRAKGLVAEAANEFMARLDASHRTELVDLLGRLDSPAARAALLRVVDDC